MACLRVVSGRASQVMGSPSLAPRGGEGLGLPTQCTLQATEARGGAGGAGTRASESAWKGEPVRGRAQPASCLTGRGFWSAKCQADGKRGAHSPRVGRVATAKGSCGRWERRTCVSPVACHTDVQDSRLRAPNSTAHRPQEPLDLPGDRAFSKPWSPIPSP